MTIEERVRRGAALLDETYHRWWKYVRTTVGFFDMGNPNRCVLGQLYGSFGEGCAALRVSGFSNEFGFDTDGEDSYAMLQELWRSTIEARR